MRQGKPPRTVAILAMPGVQMLDVAGPLDVFAEANVQSGRAAYQTSVIGMTRSAIVSSSGIRLLPDVSLDDAEAAFDTLLVAGAPHLSAQSIDPLIIDWLRAREEQPPLWLGMQWCAGTCSLRPDRGPPHYDPLVGRRRP